VFYTALATLIGKSIQIPKTPLSIKKPKTTGWIIDLGPEGGHKGGEILFCGTPEDIVKEERSYSGQFLRHLLV